MGFFSAALDQRFTLLLSLLTVQASAEPLSFGLGFLLNPQTFLTNELELLGEVLRLRSCCSLNWRLSSIAS